MARVTSVKTRQYVFVLGGPLDEGFDPDRLSLYLPDGTPIDLAADPTKMVWKGTWDDEAQYVLNDVVEYEGNLYIIEEDVEAEIGLVPDDPGSDWVLMFSVEFSNPAMVWKDLWQDDVEYLQNEVVFWEDALWVAPVDIDTFIEPGVPAEGTTEFTLEFDDTRDIERYDGPWTFSSPASDNDYRHFTLATPGRVTFEALTGDWGSLAGWDGATGDLEHTTFGGGVEAPFKDLDAGSWVFVLHNHGREISLSMGATFEAPSPEWDLVLQLPAPTYELPVGGADTQLLAKASGADRDVEWVDPPADTGYVRDTIVYTTASLADLAQEVDELDMGLELSARLFKIETDVAARVRVYTTNSKRDADAARLIGTDPTGDHGLLFEFVTTADLSWALTPAVDISSDAGDGLYGLIITNLSGATDTVAVTLHYIRTE